MPHSQATTNNGTWFWFNGESDFLRCVNANPQERPQQQYACHQKLRCIETMRDVYYPSEKDGHGKGAGLTEKIHDTGECAGSLAANIHAG